MENERDHSKFIIQRFDTYIAGANTKGNFLLAFNIFLCGGIISNYKNLQCLIDASSIIYLNICLSLVFVVCLITTAFIVNAVYPFLSTGNSSTDKYHSHIFFNSVADYKEDKLFVEAYQKQENKEVEEDMAKQAFILATALKSKYNRLAWAMRLIYTELILLFISLIIIIIF